MGSGRYDENWYPFISSKMMSLNGKIDWSEIGQSCRPCNGSCVMANPFSWWVTQLPSIRGKIWQSCVLLEPYVLQAIKR